MLKNLPDDYYRKLFREEPKDSSKYQAEIASRLEPFGLEDAQDNNEVVELPLPSTFGSLNREIADAAEPYHKSWDSVHSLAVAQAPSLPTNFNCPIGWSYWHGGEWHKMDKPPSGKTMVLDIETVKVRSFTWHPTCCVCMSERGWIVWRADFNRIMDISTIPFTANNDILGYNVSYDRAYLDLEYHLEESANYFHDLMSMWIVTNGMTNQQRQAYGAFDDEEGIEDFSKPQWAQKTTTNGLAATYEFYTGKPLDKGTRDDIVDLGFFWVEGNMPKVIEYCAFDVLATHELASYLFPAYAAHRPSDINRYGAIALGSCWLPLSPERFPGYYDRCEQQLEEAEAEISDLLIRRATDYLHNVARETQADSLDWELAKTGKNKGLPKWYRDLLPKAAKKALTLSMRFAPIVLQMTWDGKRLYWEDGWRTEDDFIPHPTNRGALVLNMFLKDFGDLYESEFISVPEQVKPLVAKKTSTINWVSLRKRVQGIKTESPEGYPVVLPMMNVNGTVTGRATDKIWQVCPNPKKNRIGTELKSMIQPIPGYAIVGADIDGQESWLAALHGEQELGINGSTPFGFMVAAGDKKVKTDAPSVIAKNLGITRDVAKVCLYGTIYGQGVKGGTDVLLKATPDLGDYLAKAKAQDFLTLFKGRKGDYGYSGGMASASFTRMERLADGRLPRTVLTGAFMSKALAGCQDYKPTRVNWLVQSSGVDFRDMLVLLTKSFYVKMGITGRLLLTIHDEIRTMVKIEQVKEAAYCLQLAHLYTRAAFIRAHKLDNIPAGIAWFSEIDVDAHCLRKDPRDPQVTPTQAALPLGYTLSVKDLLDENGALSIL